MFLTADSLNTYTPGLIRKRSLSMSRNLGYKILYHYQDFVIERLRDNPKTASVNELSPWYSYNDKPIYFFCYVVGENSSEFVSTPSEGACIKGSNLPTFIPPDWCGDIVEARDSEDCELDLEDKSEWLPLLSTVVENVSAIVAGLRYFLADAGEMLTGWAAPGWV